MDVLGMLGILNVIAGLVVFIGLPVLLYWIYQRKPGRTRSNDRIVDE